MLVCRVCAVPAALSPTMDRRLRCIRLARPPCTTGAGRCPARWERRHAGDPARRQVPSARSFSRFLIVFLDRLLGDHSLQDGLLSRRRASDRDVPRRVSSEPEVFGRASHLSHRFLPALVGVFQAGYAEITAQFRSTGGAESTRRFVSSNSEEPRGGRSRSHPRRRRQISNSSGG